MLDLRLLRLRIAKVFWLARRPRLWQLLRRGVGPSIEHEEVLRGRRFATVVDVGANVGQFALWAQEVLHPQLIVSIEPQVDAKDSLELVRDLASCPMHIVIAALGEAAGTATLHITDASDSSSLLIPQISSGLAIASAQEVRVIVGDELLADYDLPRPILIKVDVQGSEGLVLRGLSSTLASVDAVLVEVTFGSLYEGQAMPGDVLRLLFDHGFRLEAISRVPGVRESWRLSQADLFFSR